ncbi:MAG TPA: ABC transporter permease [Solirubrobacteraceae bacterium]|jgi:putative ABC transport system permease protein
MFKLLLRGFFERKVRVLLTAIAVALGVALMAGTYILTDTINQSFASIFQTANKGSAVVISPAETLGRESGAETSPVTQGMLEKVRSTPGVAKAAGSIFSPGSLLRLDRKQLTSGFAPKFIASLQPAPFNSFSTTKGHLPNGPGEVAIDEITSNRASVGIGQQILIAGASSATRASVVGIVKFAGASFGGASVALVTPAEAQRLVGEKGRFDSINVAASPGTKPPELRAHIRRELPQSVDVRTGANQAAHETTNLESNLGFLRTFLLVFAYVALLVGAFIIFNTFSITIAQRTRELGLLRTLGASRRQVLRSVIEESLMLGVVGAGLGLLGGVLLAPALDQLFKAFGADLPDSGTVLEARTVIVSLLVGIVVTMLAGLAPALRATRVPPLAAMREGLQIPPRPLPTRRRLIARFLVGLIVLVVLTVVTGARAIGPVLIIVWLFRFARLSARLKRPGERPARNYRVVPALARGIGGLFTWRGIMARIAQENSIRQPGRTLVTSAALAIGLTLVAFVAVLADGAKNTINTAVNRTFAGQLVVESSQSGGEVGIPTSAAAALRTVPGVDQVTSVAFTEGRLQGKKDNISVTVIEPNTFTRLYRMEWKQGSESTLLGLGSAHAIVGEKFAEQEKLKPGSQVTVTTPTGAHVHLTVAGIARSRARILGDMTVTSQLGASAFGLREDAFDFLSYKPGETDASVKPQVDKLLGNKYPQLRSRTAAQFRKDLTGGLNGLLALIYVLLALSVIVSLFGIVNTLVLSIYERTRELGMMRAIGTSRRQVRQMIRYESLITALIGGVFGLVVGLAGSLIVVATTLSSSGYEVAIPWGTLAILLVVAALAGLMAAALPARRAAKLDLLRSLASE